MSEVFPEYIRYLRDVGRFRALMRRVAHKTDGDWFEWGHDWKLVFKETLVDPPDRSSLPTCVIWNVSLRERSDYIERRFSAYVEARASAYGGSIIGFCIDGRDEGGEHLLDKFIDHLWVRAFHEITALDRGMLSRLPHDTTMAMLTGQMSPRELKSERRWDEDVERWVAWFDKAAEEWVQWFESVRSAEGKGIEETPARMEAMSGAPDTTPLLDTGDDVDTRIAEAPKEPGEITEPEGITQPEEITEPKEIKEPEEITEPRTGASFDELFAWYHQRKDAGYKTRLQDIADKSGYSLSHVKHMHQYCPVCKGAPKSAPKST